MVNNKKIRKSRVPIQAQVIEETASAASNSYWYNAWLSEAQCCAIVLIVVGGICLKEFWAIVARLGKENSRCADTVGDDDSQGLCSAMDLTMTMIRAKYYSAIVCLLSVASLFQQFWRNDALLNSFHAMLCVSPLATSLGAFYVIRKFMTWSALRIVLLNIVLLFTTASTVKSAKQVAKPTFPLAKTLQDMSLLSFALVFGKDCWSLWMNGVEGVLDTSTSATTPLPRPAQVVLPFLIADKLTIIALVLFGLLCLDEIQKRGMLFRLSMIQFVNWFHFLPRLENHFRDLETTSTVTFCTALFAGIASFAP